MLVVLKQSRPDRDQHVQIVWSNIMTGREDNFARYSRSEVSTLSLPYDIESVLHYSATAFSRNGQYTIRLVLFRKIKDHYCQTFDLQHDNG